MTTPENPEPYEGPLTPDEWEYLVGRRHDRDAMAEGPMYEIESEKAVSAIYLNEYEEEGVRQENLIIYRADKHTKIMMMYSIRVGSREMNRYVAVPWDLAEEDEEDPDELVDRLEYARITSEETDPHAYDDLKELIREMKDDDELQKRLIDGD